MTKKNKKKKSKSKKKEIKREWMPLEQAIDRVSSSGEEQERIFDAFSEMFSRSYDIDELARSFVKTPKNQRIYCYPHDWHNSGILNEINYKFQQHVSELNEIGEEHQDSPYFNGILLSREKLATEDIPLRLLTATHPLGDVMEPMLVISRGKEIRDYNREIFFPNMVPKVWAVDKKSVRQFKVEKVNRWTHCGRRPQPHPFIPSPPGYAYPTLIGLQLEGLPTDHPLFAEREYSNISQATSELITDKSYTNPELESRQQWEDLLVGQLVRETLGIDPEMVEVLSSLSCYHSNFLVGKNSGEHYAISPSMRQTYFRINPNGISPEKQDSDWYAIIRDEMIHAQPEKTSVALMTTK